MPVTIGSDPAGSMAASTVPKTAHKPTRRNWRTTWIVLILGLTVVATTAVYMKSRVDAIAEAAFTFHCSELHKAIGERLDDHARILRSGVGLFNASEVVTRNKWRVFTKSQNLEDQLPGIQGIGFSLLIPRAELSRHIEAIRGEGFPEYRVRPDGERDVYSSIIYLEPFSDRNLRAFGYDMFSEPVRREAMEQARDTNRASLSGRVVLVQETDTDVQAGTLMYVPVYRKGMPTDTVEQRRAAIDGWVYSPYRMKDLLRGILGGRDLEKEQQLHFRIFDGDQPSAQSLLCGCCPAENEKLWSPVRFSRQMPVDFNGHHWTVGLTQIGGGFFTAEYASVWFILAGGTLITVLLSGLIQVLKNTRDEAERMAHSLTVSLRESEAHYRAIVDQAADGIFIMSCEGEIIEVNDAFAAMHGYTARELLEIGLEGLDAPESRAQVSSRIRRILAGESLTFEVEHLRKDGSHFPLEVSASLVEFSHRKCIMAFHRDITERKRIAAYAELAREVVQLLSGSEDLPDSIRRVVTALRAKVGIDAVGLRLEHAGDFPYVAQEGFSEEFLRTENTLVEREPNGGICWDEDGNVKLECTCGLVLFGKTDSANPLFTRGGSFWTNDSMTLLDLPPDRDPRHHPRNRCMQLGYASLALVPIRSQDKIIGLLQFNDRHKGRLTLATLELLEGIASHIGEAIVRRRAEEALQQSEAKHRDLFNNAADAIFIHDSTGHVLAVNPLACERLGYTHTELTSMTIVQVDSPADAPHAPERIARLMEQGSLSFETMHRRKNGSLVPIEVNSRRITWDGQAAMMSICRDITERKRTEEQLLHAQKMEAIGQLAGGVAHDFRNQLTVIQGFAEMLLRRHLVKEEGLDKVEHILKAAEHSAATTGQLLAYSRRETLSPSVQSLNDCVASIGKVLLHVIAEDIRLVVRSDGHDTVVTIDAHLFHQALMNLATNARDAMPKGGTLTIETTCVTLGPESRQIDSDLAAGPYVMVSVRDTGVGMDRETLAKAFDPFFTTKGLAKGTGLGLAMVYGFVKQSGGAIALESQPGRGTTVRLYFPRVVSAPADTPPSQEAPAIRGGGECILLVEDEASVLSVTAHLLQDAGYRVFQAASAEEALSLIDRHGDTLDVLVSDIVMPGMSGVDLAEQLRGWYPSIGVVFVSGYSGRELSKRGVNDSMETLSKPFTSESLLAKIRHALDSRRTAPGA